MARVKIEVTQAGWSVDVEIEETDNQGTAEITQDIARGFIQARHQIEVKAQGSNQSPYYATDLDELIPGEPWPHERDRNGRKEITHEAEKISD